MDPDRCVVEMSQLRADPDGWTTRQGDDPVGRAAAVDPLRQAVDPAEHRDRLSLRVEGQLPTRLDAASIARVPGIDKTNQGHVGP